VPQGRDPDRHVVHGIPPPAFGAGYRTHGFPGVVSWRFAGILGETTLRVDTDRDRGPSNLLGVLLDAYWRSLADDPLSALLFTAFVSLAGVLLVLLWHIAVYLLGL
jgi:hypothetical protein